MLIFTMHYYHILNFLKCQKNARTKSKAPRLVSGRSKIKSKFRQKFKNKIQLYEEENTVILMPLVPGRMRTPIELAIVPARTWNTAVSVQLAKKVIITSILHLLWNFIGIAD